MVWIAGQTLANSTTYTAAFSSIPQTFTHLQLRMFAKNAGTSGVSDQFWLQFNSDGTSNYAYHRLEGNGTSATSANAVTQTAAYIGYTPNNTTGYANMFSNSIIDILDYSNTSKNKTIRNMSGFDLNGAGTVGLYSGLWRSTTALNSITIASNINPFFINTRFDLYGISTSSVTGA